jgi:penicillin-binding protein 2
MLEQTLRGRRGTTVYDAAGEMTESTKPQPGADARVTIDVELQSAIEKAFDDVAFSPMTKVIERQRMNGAAVVIDVATGEVRAMASCPTYDPNTLDQTYNKLASDAVDNPMLNRATLVAREPGSTIKPVVGLGAMTAGLAGPDTRIPCNGYLVLDGRQYPNGRCWTMSIFNMTHYEVPSADPLSADALDFTDATQRSCNVFFETLGDKFRIEGLREWYDKFGLGRPTGVGLPESAGRVPSLDTPAARRRSVAWFAAIGQDQMAATPIQMANVAATIARNGVWQRPTLVPRERFAAGDRVDLHLNPEAVRMARIGMEKVVNTVAGSAFGAGLMDFGFVVAGKTGSAQSAPLKLVRVNELGKPLLDARGRKIYEPVTLGTVRGRSPVVPWYRAIGDDQAHVPSHAWMIGFAPADHPKVAFAVMVEYGGAGGVAAGSVVKRIIEACVQEGYLPAKR